MPTAGSPQYSWHTEQIYTSLFSPINTTISPCHHIFEWLNQTVAKTLIVGAFSTCRFELLSHWVQRGKTKGKQRLKCEIRAPGSRLDHWSQLKSLAGDRTAWRSKCKSAVHNLDSDELATERDQPISRLPHASNFKLRTWNRMYSSEQQNTRTQDRQTHIQWCIQTVFYRLPAHKQTWVFLFLFVRRRTVRMSQPSCYFFRVLFTTRNKWLHWLTAFVCYRRLNRINRKRCSIFTFWKTSVRLSARAHPHHTHSHTSHALTWRNGISQVDGSVHKNSPDACLSVVL